jgi:hypothetical protein
MREAYMAVLEKNIYKPFIFFLFMYLIVTFIS